MIPLFKTHYSMKSILTLEDKPEEGGPDSVWAICKEYDIKDLYLLEDSMSGFLKAYEGAKKENLNLRFGLRINCKNSEASEDSKHKIVIFALNSAGCSDLNKLSSEINVKLGGAANYDYLKTNWTKNLQLVVPYYDSFLFQNLFTFNRCMPDFSFCQPIFIKESNGLPFEPAYNKELAAFEKDYEFLGAKSIYYKTREDFKAWQTFKCMHRKGFGKSTLEKPEMAHCSSNEFCIESWNDER
jgi:DNA polymerase III alpha subunit